MQFRRAQRLLNAVLSLLWLTQFASAQAIPSKEPSSTHIFPAGGQRGTVVPVRVGTEALPPGANLRVWGDGIRAPEQVGDRVRVSYEPSPRRPPRDADGAGAASSYPIEWASELAIAADAPLGVAAWRLTCGWGGTQPRPFVIGDLPEFVETESNSSVDRAERIALPVTVNGQIAGERDLDCFAFAAKEGQFVVADVLTARIGSPLDPVVVLSTAGGRKLSAQRLRVAGDDVMRFHIPADGDYVLQVANVGFRGGPEFVYRINLGWEQSAKPDGATHVPVAGLADSPHPTSSSLPTSVTPPCTLQGRFLTATAEGSFRLSAKRDELFAIACLPASRASTAMPIVAIEDAAGRTLAKASSVESADRECRMEWRAPADGEYLLRVRDLQHGVRGGPEFSYRLSIQTAKPDFSLRLATDYANVTQGGRAELDLAVKRAGGFAGPIELAATGLPEGVTFEPARIAENQSSVKLVLKAGDETRPTDAALRVTGAATIDGKSVERAVEISHFGDTLDAGLPAAVVDTVQLTVQHQPIVRLTCSEAYQYAHRGTIYPYTMRLERLQGFDGEVHIQLCERQVQDLDGVEIVETVVPPGATEFPNLIYFPETMHASEQHHCRPYAQAWATFTDKWGQRQSMLAIADKRCMVRTLPAVLQLKALDDRVTAQPGGTVRCRLALQRTPNFTGAMDIRLVQPPAELGISAEPVRIEPEQVQAEITVRIGDAATTSGDFALQFCATGQLGENTTALSHASVLLRIAPHAGGGGVGDVTQP